MNIAMFTNTYLPHVGGVAKSVSSFSNEFRDKGHHVLVVAPEFENMQTQENNVVRIPAIQKFNMSDFSVALPVSGLLSEPLNNFNPDIIHAHHPYLLGMTALRIARFRHIPIVFTHHTLYEKYTHYVPGDSDLLKKFVIELATHYANLVDLVFSPSLSIAQLLHKRGVHTPIEEVPTGVDINRFRNGNGDDIRRKLDITPDRFVVGHLGRLAQEKNLEFLCHCLIRFLQENPNSDFLVIGKGPMEGDIRKIFDTAKLGHRLHIEGILSYQDLTNTLHAMNVFAFTSKSETQGMVLTEAMAAGLPVIALDAPGAREVIRDGINGRLLQEENIDQYVNALHWIAGCSEQVQQELIANALSTAELYSIQNTAEKALKYYNNVCAEYKQHIRPAYADDIPHLYKLMGLIQAEWELIKSYAESGSHALMDNRYE